MIDYDKLKQAHELAIAWQKNSDTPVILNFMVSGFEDKGLIETRMSFLSGHECYVSIDDLITKLTELTQPELKYKDGWYLDKENMRPVCTKFHNGDCYLFCDKTDIGALGKVAYPSKAALIEAQLAYWREKLSEALEQHVSPYCEPIKDCKHEWESENPGADRTCKKCGEYENFSMSSRKCEHESDGYIHPHDPEYKCIKCGKFYK